MRRGEVPFVAIRVGRSNDPREVLGLARELKIDRARALGFLALWEELILEIGDGMTGRVRGYKPVHIAEKLGWEGSPARLLRALRNAGVITSHRGTFLHPYWLTSITGQYARQRAEQREQWRLQKKKQREDVRETSGGQAADGGVDSGRTADMEEGRNGGPGAERPPAPPQGGGSVGFARWEWIARHHPRPINRGACVRYLEAMTADDWALCQWVLEDPDRKGLYSHRRKKRALMVDSRKFLSDQLYLQFVHEWEKKLAEAPAADKPKVKAVAEPTSDERREAARAFIVALLSDPDLTEAEKEAAKAKWVRANPGEAIPDVGGAA